MHKTVDSYRFLAGISRRMIKNWVELESPRPIPWTPLAKPLSECTVAIISSAGIALTSDTPFDQSIERENPWYSDPSFRVIPASARGQDIQVYHLHINGEFIEQDINCALPIERLQELAASGEIGHVAPSHYSFIGYTCKADDLLNTSIPAIIDRLCQDRVDVVVLVPI